MLCTTKIHCGSEPARESGRSDTAQVKTQRLPIERRVPGGAAPGVLVWPFFAPFLYQGWLAFFAAAKSPGLNGNLNAGIAALVSLSALESTLSGRSAWSSLKASATGGCVGEVMKAPGDAHRVGPGQRAAKGGSITGWNNTSCKPRACPSGFVLTDPPPSLECRPEPARSHKNSALSVGASLLAMNDNAAKPEETLSAPQAPPYPTPHSIEQAKVPKRDRQVPIWDFTNKIPPKLTTPSVRSHPTDGLTGL